MRLADAASRALNLIISAVPSCSSGSSTPALLRRFSSNLIRGGSVPPEVTESALMMVLIAHGPQLRRLAGVPRQGHEARGTLRLQRPPLARLRQILDLGRVWCSHES